LGEICCRLADEEEKVVTAYSGPLYAKRLEKAGAGAQVLAFPGIWVIGDRLNHRAGEWFDGDPDAGLVSATVMNRAAKAAMRMAGVRDILVEGHPVVTGLLDKLSIDRAHVPGPDVDIVAKLEKLKGFAIDGKIVTIDGVPVPAGKAQADWFVVQRYRPLYAPGALPHLIYRRDPENIAEVDRATLGIPKCDKASLIHLLAYDAANVTDEMQEALLSYSTAIHRDYLVALQRDHTALYVAIWRRDMAVAKRLLRIGRRCGPLPPVHPKSVRKFAKHLLNGTALMNEFERLFEIIENMKVAGGATRQSIDKALKSSASLSALHAASDAASRFLAGSVAHVRSLHPMMNTKSAKPKTADPILEAARTAFVNARGYWEKTARIEWIDRKMPGQWYLGIEPAMLASVALIQMIWNMARCEDGFWLRGKRGNVPDTDDERRALVVELAVVITGNICLPTARSMLPPDKVDKALAALATPRSDEEWRDAIIPMLIRNPALADQVEALVQKSGMAWPVPENADCDRPRHSSPYDRAMKRALVLKSLNQPGWTQGFLFEAWLRPNAELAFLRNCCRYIRFDQAQAHKRDAWNATLAQVTHRDGRPITATDIATGLPRQHPLECIQDRFRDSFDRMQVADGVSDRAVTTARQRAWREAAIAEVAALLPAISPITLDPQLAERWWRDLDENLVSIAAEGAWNM
jgi:hypothetical protein